MKLSSKSKFWLILSSLVAVIVTTIATIDIYEEEGSINIGISAMTLFFGFIFGSGISLVLILLNNRIRNIGNPRESYSQIEDDNYQNVDNTLFLRLCEYDHSFEIEFGGLGISKFIEHFRPNDRVKVISGSAVIKDSNKLIVFSDNEIQNVKTFRNKYEQHRYEKINDLRIDFLDLNISIGISTEQFPTLIFAQENFDKDLIKYTIKAIVENNGGYIESEFDILELLTESKGKYILISKSNLLEFDSLEDLRNFTGE